MFEYSGTKHLIEIIDEIIRSQKEIQGTTGNGLFDLALSLEPDPIRDNCQQNKEVLIERVEILDALVKKVKESESDQVYQSLSELMPFTECSLEEMTVKHTRHLLDALDKCLKRRAKDPELQTRYLKLIEKIIHETLEDRLKVLIFHERYRKTTNFFKRLFG